MTMRAQRSRGKLVPGQARLVKMAVPIVIITLAGTGCTARSSSGGEASCAKLSHKQYTAAAHLVFKGIMLAGPTAKVGDREVLTGNVRVRVSHYLKGHGPAVVTVVSAVNQAGNNASAEGIEPGIGQQNIVTGR